MKQLSKEEREELVNDTAKKAAGILEQKFKEGLIGIIQATTEALKSQINHKEPKK